MKEYGLHFQHQQAHPKNKCRILPNQCRLIVRLLYIYKAEKKNLRLTQLLIFTDCFYDANLHIFQKVLKSHQIYCNYLHRHSLS